ncbi:zf-HC2 domain-containing protein [Marinomonas rhizomae]|jgi:predicted anti-sigma-YlaC factor YlaD|uniref:zf-HC2 domain-containing protein n=1 Tax=Marinomonas rhizomae TaxID=491948 RepID=UPI00210314D2|nr:zf-HC2 domain-containing protein [Marinomonas rhizomae]UTV99801.1 zf-HC2 domain-containing protein [Marinomonas rhizomae]
MIKCKQATQMLSEKLDRPLSAKEKINLAMHTAICGPCRQFGKQMEAIRELSRSYTQKKPSNKKQSDKK